MSEGELVRWAVPPGVPATARVLVRAPQPIRPLLARVTLGRPVTSRLRRRVVTDLIRLGFHLLKHRDQRGAVEQILGFYAPNCEIHIGPGFALDAQPVYLGHAGWRAVMRLWDEVGALSFTPREVLDMGGECIGVLVSVSLTGVESGAQAPPVQAVWTYTLRQGLIVRQDVSHDGWETGPAELAAALERSTSAG